MRFFIKRHSNRDETAEEITQEALEEQFGFKYSDEVIPDDTFTLSRPYNLAKNTDIIPSSKLHTKYRVLKNPEEALVLSFISEECGWGVFAKKDIEPNTIIIAYTGTVYNANHSPDNDDYMHAVSTPYNDYLDFLKEFEKMHAMPSKSKYIACISAHTIGNLSRFFQHLPSNTGPFSSYEDLAYENLRHITAFDEEREIPMTFMVTSCFVPAGHQIGFNYGDLYWKDKSVLPQCFTLRGRDFSPHVLHKLKRLNQKWQKLLNVLLKNPGDSGPGGIHLPAEKYMFFSYTDLCDLACVNRAYNRELTPALRMLRK